MAPQSALAAGAGLALLHHVRLRLLKNHLGRLSPEKISRD
jgi:hypothetical protein